MAFRIFFASLLLPLAALANIQKAVFEGPPSVRVPSQHPTLSDLRLDTLTPAHPLLRTHLLAEFPQNVTHFGRPSWLLMDSLVEGQRYEVRVCWAATQPSEFTLQVFDLPTVWESPELLSSLSSYAYARQSDPSSPVPEYGGQPVLSDDDRESSLLFLRIFSAADYFSVNKTLMEDIPPVYVDIALDPYFRNMLPWVLIGPVSYAIAVGIVSWFLGHAILAWLRGIADSEFPSDEKKDQ